MSKQVAGLIRERCIERGWDLGRLAEAAEVSRQTLSKILQGKTSRPHLATLSRIAAALEIAPHELSSGSVAAATTHLRRRAFDERTNGAVRDAIAQAPALAAGWGERQWDELYSTFGVGGALTSDGARSMAAEINRKEEIVAQLQVVLETHLAEVAERLIGSLYGMVAIDAEPDAGASRSRPERHV